MLWWALFVQWRIIHRRIRRCLLLAAGFLCSLFLIRLCRWSVFDDYPVLIRYLWYAYYIPFLTVPALSFQAAICVGKDEDAPLPRYLWGIWGITALLLAGILTNDLHAWFLQFPDPSDQSIADHGWLYFAVVGWSAMLTLAGYCCIVGRCRLSQCRRLWYVPVIPPLFGVLLLFVYFVCGGSPTVAGIRLYCFQEAYAEIYLGMWEMCIQIGLIPSNTGYSELFELSHIGAQLR